MAVETLTIRVLADGTRVVRREIEGIGDAARDSGAGVRLLRTALGGLGLGVLIKEFVQLADGMTSITNRLANVTDNSYELKAVMQELFDLSNRTRSSFEENAGLYNRLALSTRQLGLSQSDLLGITETMNQAISVSGVRAQEASNALIQLSQGMASGRLNGDELRSVLEQLPPVADILARQLGVTRGELRKLGADGKITTKVIVEAFQGAADEVAASFAKMTPTIGQSLVVLRNNFTQLIAQFSNATNSVPLLSKAILWVADNLEVLLKSAIVVAAFIGGPIFLGAFGAATAAAWSLVFALATNPYIAVATVIAALIAYVVLFGDKVTLTADTMTNLQDVGLAVWESFSSAVVSAWTYVDNFLQVISGGWASLNIDLKTFLDAAIVGIEQVFQASAAMTMAIIALYKGIWPAAQEQFTNLANGAIGIFEWMLNEIVRFFVLLPERMLLILTDGINLMIKAFGLLVEYLKGLPQVISDIFANAMAMAGQKVKEGIDFIGNVFERIPGIKIPDLAETADSIIEIADTNADSIGAALSALGQGYADLKAGENLIKFDRLDNDLQGSTVQLGKDVGTAFNQGLEETPISEWWKDILARADALNQKSRDAARLKSEDDRLHPPGLDVPGVATPVVPGKDAGADAALKKMQQLKDAVADLELTLDNQVLAEAGRVREIENTQATQLETIRKALEARILTEQQAADRIVAINETAARKIRDIEYARYSQQLTAASETFDSLSEIAKGFAGEQSGIYKAMFVASKAFAIADSLIKIQQGIANALALPFPANLGAVAAVAAAAANIVSNIQAVSAVFADGGYVQGSGTSRSDSINARLSNGEFVVNSAATKAYRPLLESINSGSTPALSGSVNAQGGSSRGGGTTLQIIDQRTGGQDIQVQSSKDANGDETIRAIVRDEVSSTYAQTARQRSMETISTVRNGQKRGAFFSG